MEDKAGGMKSTKGSDGSLSDRTESCPGTAGKASGLPTQKAGVVKGSSGGSSSDKRY